MKIFPQCMSCLIEQIERSIKLLSSDYTNEQILTAQQKLMREISTLDLLKIESPVLGKITYRIIGETLDTKDPFYELKNKYNTLAMGYYPKVKAIAEKELDPLRAAIEMSILGNSIDFGAPTKINLQEELDNIKKNIKSSSKNLNELINYIKNSNIIMIIGDNCGEIVFDKLFLEILHNQYPKKELYYAVRSGPIINDATIEDAQKVRIDEFAKIVETSQTPGIYLEECSNEFLELLHKSDLLIAKGQGNLEAIIDMKINPTTFFLLKAKCGLMMKIFDVPLGSLIVAKKTEDLEFRADNIK